MSLALGCVDVLSVPETGETGKLFVVCELKIGQDIKAEITMAGDTKGGIPKPFPNLEQKTFGISEEGKDLNCNFSSPREEESYYSISAGSCQIKEGVNYNFTGIIDIDELMAPNITIPYKVALDSFIIHKVIKTAVGDSTLTVVDCTIRIKDPKSLPAYFYINPTTDGGGKCSVVFNDHMSAYVKLLHREGILVDYSRLENNELNLTISKKDKTPMSKLNIAFDNTTESFYRYNRFVSNISASQNPNTENPAIAGLNINTSQAIGTFSALNGNTWSFEIK